MVSLLHLADITEEGVAFQSPVDGKRMLLTPEHSMGIQNRLGNFWASLSCSACHGEANPSPEAKCLMPTNLIH